MNKGTELEVFTKEQNVLAEEIKAYHAGFNQTFDHQAQYAFMTGLKLIALKDSCENGNKAGATGFMKLREALLPEISRSAATRFMDFCRLLQEKLPTVGNFKSEQLKLTNGDLPTSQKEKVLKAVYEATDGKTWTQLYRDLGKTREKKPAQHHPRKPMSPEEKLEAARETAVMAFNAWMFQTKSLLLMPEPILAELKRDERQQMLDAGTQLNNEVRKFLTKKHA